MCPARIIHEDLAPGAPARIENGSPVRRPPRTGFVFLWPIPRRLRREPDVQHHGRAVLRAATARTEQSNIAVSVSWFGLSTPRFARTHRKRRDRQAPGTGSDGSPHRSLGDPGRRLRGSWDARRAGVVHRHAEARSEPGGQMTYGLAGVLRRQRRWFNRPCGSHCPAAARIRCEPHGTARAPARRASGPRAATPRWRRNGAVRTA